VSFAPVSMKKVDLAAAPAAIPTTVARWFANPATVEKFRGMIESPEFQLAAATLKELEGPNELTVTTSAEVNSQRLAWYAGLRYAFTGLHKLSKLPTQVGNATDTEWNHINTLTN